MRHNRDEVHGFKISVSVSPTYFVPLFFKDKVGSFQWAKTKVIPLKRLPGNNKGSEKELDEAFEISYDIPAISIDDAIDQSIEIINFILNVASFYYSIGLVIKSPVSVINIDTGEGISYDFHRLEITKEAFCTKIIDTYLPMLVKDGEKKFKLSSEEILTYEPSEIFKVDDFYQTIDLFKTLYFDYIKAPKLKMKVEFSLNMLKEAFQIPSFISRFILYWRAFEKLMEPEVKSGIVSQESLNLILDVLKKQENPKLSDAGIERIRKQICNTHLKSKTNLIIDEMKKYFNESDEKIREVYKRLNDTRQKIIHSEYKGDNTFELWANTELLRSVVKQIIKVHFKYPKVKFRKPSFEKILQIREAAKPKIQIVEEDN